MTTTLEAPVPTFDDEDGGGRKMAIICSKGSLDMAYPGLVLANAALSEGVEVHLFFTFWGFDMINKKTMGSLRARGDRALPANGIRISGFDRPTPVNPYR